MADARICCFQLARARTVYLRARRLLAASARLLALAEHLRHPTT